MIAKTDTPKTLIIGASENTERYSNKAAKMLLDNKHDFELIGIKSGIIYNKKIQTGLPQIKNIDTITLYLNPKNQEAYFDYILNLKPKRVIFNPGTENKPFEILLNSKGIKTVEACTLVMLSIGTY